MSQDIRETESSRGRNLAAQLDLLRRQMEQTRAEQRRLRNTLGDIARESDVSLGSVCCHCDEAYMLVKDRTMSCPSCPNRTTV